MAVDWRNKRKSTEGAVVAVVDAEDVPSSIAECLSGSVELVVGGMLGGVTKARHGTWHVCFPGKHEQIRPYNT